MKCLWSKIVFNINIAMQLTNGINNYPWKRATCVSKKKYIRSPLKIIIIIRTVSFSLQSKIRLEIEEIFKKKTSGPWFKLLSSCTYTTLWIGWLIKKYNPLYYKNSKKGTRILQNTWKKTKISLKNVFFLFKKTSSSILWRPNLFCFNAKKSEKKDVYI